MAEFFAMGGYAEYVWSCFALGLLTVVYNIVAARRRIRAVMEKATLNAARQRHRSSRRRSEATKES